MAAAEIERVARALLYEGYILYPYRPSSAKNQYRQTIGTLFPEACQPVLDGFERSAFEAQCLVEFCGDTHLECTVRFLQEVAPKEATQSQWSQAVEREASIRVGLAELISGTCAQSFTFGAAPELMHVKVELDLSVVADGLCRLSLRCRNQSAGGHRMTMISAHAILHLRRGSFVSLLDPPAQMRPYVAQCHNVGVWPVLVGESGSRDTVLCAPIILYDYPRVAPESPGDLFDSTEIDEILTLRIRTLTDHEKAEMARTDERAARLLERTEALSADELLRLHGAFRGVELRSAAPWFREGDRVRLRPRGGADAFDTLLAGRVATVSAVEHDFDGRVHLAVTLDDDPGKDLGRMGHPGHRFYYSPHEVEPLGAQERGS